MLGRELKEGDFVVAAGITDLKATLKMGMIVDFKSDYLDRDCAYIRTIKPFTESNPEFNRIRSRVSLEHRIIKIDPSSVPPEFATALQNSFALIASES